MYDMIESPRANRHQGNTKENTLQVSHWQENPAARAADTAINEQLFSPSCPSVVTRFSVVLGRTCEVDNINEQQGDAKLRWREESEQVLGQLWGT